MEEWFVHVEEYTEALKKKEQQKEQNQEGVRLMTLHASKGLEFHTVFLIEANEGRIPYQKAEKRAECGRRAQVVLRGNDPGKGCVENYICENKKRKGEHSFPLCRRIV